MSRYVSDVFHDEIEKTDVQDLAQYRPAEGTARFGQSYPDAH